MNVESAARRVTRCSVNRPAKALSEPVMGKAVSGGEVAQLLDVTSGQRVVGRELPAREGDGAHGARRQRHGRTVSERALVVDVGEAGLAGRAARRASGQSGDVGRDDGNSRRGHDGAKSLRKTRLRELWLSPVWPIQVGDVGPVVRGDPACARRRPAPCNCDRRAGLSPSRRVRRLGPCRQRRRKSWRGLPPRLRPPRPSWQGDLRVAWTGHRPFVGLWIVDCHADAAVT